MAQVHVPRVSEVGAAKSREDLAADREWREAAQRRANLRSALAQVAEAKSRLKDGAAHRAKSLITPAVQWRNLKRQTRSF